MKVLRTPEDRFAGLPDFGYPPRYADVDGLRLAYVEAGPADGEPVLLLHGEPSWSFLYRKVMPVLAEAGLRAIA
ncbi:MAG TPA: haloalkane dehalogenase, partial [Streptosporangiaceae bacterium]|nr:haloalkane dehalogenase [Streptosporangiaceae bacterium]